jgi:hypothetical protein
MQDFILKVLGICRDDVENQVMWHRTLRGEQLSNASRSVDRPGLRPIESMAHIDTDIGAYGLEGLSNLYS